MNLRYDDRFGTFSDTEKVYPLIQDICSRLDTLSPSAAQAMASEALLDLMEENHQVLVFYSLNHQHRQLEKYMRMQEQYLRVLEERGVKCIGLDYLNLLFLRLNMLLYREIQNNNSAADYAGQTHDCLLRCLEWLDYGVPLAEDQKQFVLTECLATANDIAAALEANQDQVSRRYVLKSLFPYMDNLEVLISGEPAVMHKASELLQLIGQSYYEEGDARSGSECFSDAESWLLKLAEMGSSFHLAECYWCLSQHAALDNVATGDTGLLEQCIHDTDQTLKNASCTDAERGILLGASACAEMQTGTYAMLSGNMAQCTRHYEKAHDGFLKASQLLDAKLNNPSTTVSEDFFYRPAAAKINMNLLSVSQALGVHYYATDRNREAIAILEDVLRRLSDTSQFGMNDIAALRIHASSCFYLGILYNDQGNLSKAEVYTTQALNEMEKLLKTGEDAELLDMQIVNCRILSGICLSRRDKAQAGELASRGLTCCRRLATLNPEHARLRLAGELEQIQRKASRRFF